MQVLDEQSRDFNLFEKAEEFARGGVDGAKKLGTVAKNQLLKPVDMLAGERNASANTVSGAAESKESFKTKLSPRRAEAGKSAAIVGVGKLQLEKELEMAENNELKKS